MKKLYTSPKVTEFGTVENLTQYGTGGGSNDSVYLASAGMDAVLFFMSPAGGSQSLANAQVATAGAIAAAPGGPGFLVALANIQGGAAGKGASFCPTLGTSFTV